MRQRKSGSGNSAKRPVVRLDRHLEKKLISYALAASAAGVSVLACSPQAEAKVFFTDTWIPIAPNTATTNIDLTNGGTVNFTIANKQSCSTYHCFETMNVLPQNSRNAVWGANTYASALGSGVSLGSNGQFQAGHQRMAADRAGFGRSGTESYRSTGQWRQATRLFLGVKFIIQGEIHYGWVRVDAAATFAGMYAAVTGYAYESVPNQPIKTGQTSGSIKKRNQGTKGSAAAHTPPPSSGSLGQLAIGALGLGGRKKPGGISRLAPTVGKGESS
jgi:hypothetical protein